MFKRNVYSQLSVLFLLFFLLGLSACGFQSQASQAALSNTTDKPLGTGATPEPGNDGKPAPTPDGHTQSIVEAHGIVYIGSDNGTLYAVNVNDGTVRWHQTLGSFVTVAAVIDGTVYVSTDAVVSAFDAMNGIRRWQHSISDLIVNPTLMVSNGVLFVSTEVSHNNNAHAIYALRATDGSQLWKYIANSITPTLSGASNGIVYSVEIVGDFVQGDEHVVALQANDGHVLWRMHIESTDGQIMGTPVESNGILYILTNSDALYALQTATGTIIWHIASSANGQQPPAIGAAPVDIVDGVVYANTHQGLLALRASNGTLLWEKKSMVSMIPLLFSPVVSNGRIYVASASGTISALRVQDGSQVWQVPNTPVEGSSLTVENALIYINAPNEVYALRAQDGVMAWKQSLDHHNGFSSSDTSMLAVDGMVYVSKDSGVVQALRASDGKSLWSYSIQELAVPTDFVYGASITFASTVSYVQALKVIADLGLQLSVFCPDMWTPQLNESVFSNHPLTVFANVNSAPLWLTRLKATAGVQDTQVAGPHSCPMMTVSGDSSRLSLQQSGTFVQVTFSPTVSYNNALEAVSDLWFRMANPCYEQARAQGTKPTWHAQGQTDTFTQTHSFILATTTLNSVHWLEQLHAAAGVVQVDTSLKMTC